MREISPFKNLSTDELLERASPEVQQLVLQIRNEKIAGTRPHPSSTLIDRSTLLNPLKRQNLLDMVAELVDENLFGRAEMCIQFADLLQRSLTYLGFNARASFGLAIYYSGEQEVFRWNHAWVRIENEIVDGNVDSLFENPLVPSSVSVMPYWGPITKTPSDRKLREFRGQNLPHDEDVSDIWWPELQSWLNKL